MAIKGKGRTRSGRRVISAPPRPQLVVPKPPIWRRRSVQVVAATVVVVGVAVFLTVFFTARSHKHFKNREIAALRTVSQDFVSALPTGTQRVPPDLFVVYPGLSGDLNNLRSGTLKPADAVTKATDTTLSAGTSQNKIRAINLTKLIPADFDATTLPGVTGRGMTRAQLQEAQAAMVDAFNQYQHLGAIMKLAAAATAAEKAQLIQQAQTMLTQAAATWDRGFRIVLNIRRSLGIPLTLQSTG